MTNDICAVRVLQESSEGDPLCLYPHEAESKARFKIDPIQTKLPCILLAVCCYCGCAYSEDPS